MNIKLVVSALCALLLAACGSQKEASNANFEKALNAHFAKNCIPVDPYVAQADNHTYPVTVRLVEANGFYNAPTAARANANTTKKFDVLVQAGVLAASNGPREPMYPGASDTIPTRIYALTDLGKKSLASPESTSLCIGHFKVDSIDKFTEPVQVNGRTASLVSFTASPIDVPEWAKTPDLLATYGLSNLLDGHAKASREAVLKGDGWVDAADVGSGQG